MELGKAWLGRAWLGSCPGKAAQGVAWQEQGVECGVAWPGAARLGKELGETHERTVGEREHMKAIEKALERMIEKTLGETEAECADAAATHPVTPGYYIAVLDRGWVYVGNCRINGEWLEITDAKNIRRWGTSKGLGELRSGPTTETKWDQAGDIKAPVKSLITLISCLSNHNW